MVEIAIASRSDYLPQLKNEDSLQVDERNLLAVRYFQLGFSYKEILLILFTRHWVRLSLQQLKRIFWEYGLRRKGLTHKSPLNEVIDNITDELNGSG